MSKAKQLLVVTIAISILLLISYLLDNIFITFNNLLKESVWLAIIFIILILFSVFILYIYLFLDKRVYLKKKITNIFLKRKKITFEQQNEKVQNYFDKSGNSISVADKNIVPVIGVKYSGKTSIIEMLKSKKIEISFTELKAISSSLEDNELIINKYLNYSLYLFVVTQDITNYEYEVIKMLSKCGQVIIILNKIDILKNQAKKEIVSSIQKHVNKFNNIDIVSISASPMESYRVIQSGDGKEIEQVYIPNPNIDELYNILELIN